MAKETGNDIQYLSHLALATLKIKNLKNCPLVDCYISVGAQNMFKLKD